MTEAELKPCPFCGDIAQCYEYSEPATETMPALQLWRVSCAGCYVRIEGIRSHALAVFMWDTRVPHDGLVEALKALLHRHRDGSEEQHWGEWDTARNALKAAGVEL